MNTYRRIMTDIGLFDEADIKSVSSFCKGSDNIIRIDFKDGSCFIRMVTRKEAARLVRRSRGFSFANEIIRKYRAPQPVQAMPITETEEEFAMLHFMRMLFGLEPEAEKKYQELLNE